MHQQLVPFGVGTRQCGGQNLAHLMMRVVIAVVVRNCEVRADVHALFPEAGGTRLAPKEHEGRQEKLLGTLNELEDVLEALQLAARSGRPGSATAGGGG